MADQNETTFLQEGPVKITGARAIIGTLTYPMSQIRAVHVTRRGRSMKPLLLTIPGILLIVWSLIDQTAQFMEFFNIGIALIVVSVVVVVIAKPTYAIRIGNSAGDTSILRSTDLNFIQRIAAAMNKASAREK
jgi:uncharacterized protein DUF6232